MKNFKKKFLRLFAPLLGAGAIGVCPVCWAGSAALLTYLGLGAIIPYWPWLAVIVLILAGIGFVFDYKAHHNMYPLIVFIMGGVLLYTGRYVFGGAGFGGWQIWGLGIILVTISVFYNKKMFNIPTNIIETQFLFQCKECGLKYKEKQWMEKCEKWCRENKSCNLDIIKHAIKEDDS